MYIFTDRIKSMRKGNVLTGVCHSVHPGCGLPCEGGGSALERGCLHGGGPPYGKSAVGTHPTGMYSCYFPTRTLEESSEFGVSVRDM